MEAMGLVWAAFRDVSYVSLSHPFLSLLGSFALGVLMIRFYCRLTTVMCDCDKDMTGKTVLITGATSGIGRETAKDLARRNAKVIMACRDVTKGHSLAEYISKTTGNTNIIIQELVLDSFDSVRECAENIIRTTSKLDVLINNAGIAYSASPTIGDNETFMHVNHYSHFLLTLLLLDLLKKSTPSRIINVSSAAYKLGKFDSDKIDITGDMKSRLQLELYGRSKLANILFTRELASRLKNTGVTVNALHPGAVNTGIMTESNKFFPLFMKTVLFLFGKSAEEGAQTSIYLAVHPEVEYVTGKYFSDCKERTLVGQALDNSLAKKLFEKSEEVVNYKFR